MGILILTLSLMKGAVVKVSRILITGNQHFSQEKLLAQLKMTEHHWWSWISGE